MEIHNDNTLELGGKLYNTVKINNLLWMAENLSLLVKDSWFYMDNALNGPVYGRLYSWEAAMDACPDGWRLPALEDWDDMINFLGGEKKAFHELLPNGTSGFNAIFSGYRSISGDFLSLERAADFWTSTEAGEANAWLFYLIYKKDKVFKIIDDKRCGFSVRYVRDL
jgi:uncharacterized protein (TIGR02145 family)